MMGKSRLLISTVTLLLSVLPGMAPAQTQVSATVTQVSIYAGSSAQGAVLYITPAVPNLEGCTNTAGNLLWIDFSSATQPDGKALYATVLAALAQGQRMA